MRQPKCFQQNNSMKRPCTSKPPKGFLFTSFQACKYIYLDFFVQQLHVPAQILYSGKISRVAIFADEGLRSFSHFYFRGSRDLARIHAHNASYMVRVVIRYFSR